MLSLAAVLWRQSREELRPCSSDPKPEYAPIRNETPELTRVVDAQASCTRGAPATAASAGS
jgi:hypothetical protein